MKREVLFVTALALSSHSTAGWFDSAADLLDSASKATAVASDVMKSSDEKAEAVQQATTSESLTNTAVALLPSLTQSLGVSESQAAGGLGSLFQLAQGSLSGSDFSSLSNAVPGMDSLLGAAPKVASEETQGLASGLMNMAGLPGDAVSSAATVAAQFKQLGLSPAMIPQYIQITSQFLQSNGGKQAVDLFTKGVASLL